MIAGGVGLLVSLVVSANRNASARGSGLESSEAFDEPDHRLTAGWPRR
jgi:hypothetical protein